MMLKILEKLEEIEKEIYHRGDRWLDTKQASIHTNVSAKTLERAVTIGELKVSKKTGKNLYRKSELDRWLRS